jgi:hypothetical protein
VTLAAQELIQRLLTGACEYEVDLTSQEWTPKLLRLDIQELNGQPYDDEVEARGYVLRGLLAIQEDRWGDALNEAGDLYISPHWEDCRELDGSGGNAWGAAF